MCSFFVAIAVIALLVSFRRNPLHPSLPFASTSYSSLSLPSPPLHSPSFPSPSSSFVFPSVSPPPFPIGQNQLFHSQPISRLCVSPIFPKSALLSTPSRMSLNPLTNINLIGGFPSLSLTSPRIFRNHKEFLISPRLSGNSLPFVFFYSRGGNRFMKESFFFCFSVETQWISRPDPRQWSPSPPLFPEDSRKSGPSTKYAVSVDECG